VIAVRTAPGQQIDSAPRSPTILGRIAIGNDLEFTDGFLGDSGADAVGGVIDGVEPIDVHQVCTGALAAEVES